MAHLALSFALIAVLRSSLILDNKGGGESEATEAYLAIACDWGHIGADMVRLQHCSLAQ